MDRDWQRVNNSSVNHVYRVSMPDASGEHWRPYKLTRRQTPAEIVGLAKAKCVHH